MKDIIGPAGSAPDELPTAAAELRIILVPCTLGLSRHGRKRKRGRRWRVPSSTVAVEQSGGSAASVLADAAAFEVPTAAAELTIILCALHSPGPSRHGRKLGRGSRKARPWTLLRGRSPVNSRHLGGSRGARCAFEGIALQWKQLASETCGEPSRKRPQGQADSDH